MTPILYPAELPGPSSAPFRYAERRLKSDDPFETRAVQRDRLGTQQVTFPPFTAAQAAVFEAWWRDTLIYGGAWFASKWPQPQGSIPWARRFMGAPKWQFLAGGYWRVTADFEVRGLGVLPQLYEQVLAVTWNPLTKWSNILLSNGNRTATIAEYDPYFGEDTHGGSVLGSLGKSAGKWYFEIFFDLRGGDVSGRYSTFGIASLDESIYAYVGSTGLLVRSGSGSSTTTAELATGDTIRIAFDMGAGQVWLSKNSTWIGGGDPASGTLPTLDFGSPFTSEMYPQSRMVDHGFDTLTLRAAQSDFGFSIPAGFLAYES